LSFFHNSQSTVIPLTLDHHDLGIVLPGPNLRQGHELAVGRQLAGIESGLGEEGFNRKWSGGGNRLSLIVGERDG
jgi:hypothetical protein